jgi:hypothetical protein
MQETLKNGTNLPKIIVAIVLWFLVGKVLYTKFQKGHQRIGLGLEV